MRNTTERNEMKQYIEQIEDASLQLKLAGIITYATFWFA